MKVCLLVLFFFALIPVSAAAQAKRPDEVAKEFYKWYLTELNLERHPITQNKTRMRGYISARLARWIYSPAYSEYGADYFIDAQDWERTWADGVSAKRPVITGAVATVRIQLDPAKGVFSGFGRRTLPIRLVKEGGSWKIDLVNNRQLTK
jgi:hypothetical protein